ncbi:TetR/AcrR family transcriptional regulator [Paenibacillus sp. GCM10012306]|uniref:TetR/AcrR family transcriptional regulator n=1 Tax=Paenibacillus sp. GCM10012306 TaxID=3317342 RepID=UPI0036125AAF
MASAVSHNPKDLRVIKTRQLILDSFINLLGKKDFMSITVSDITRIALINRATFYAHFPDKYGLLKALLSDAFMNYVDRRVPNDAKLTEETIKQLVIALCDYHEESSRQCVKNYESVAPLVEKNIISELEEFVFLLLSRTCQSENSGRLERAATVISWSIYGSAYRWYLNGKKETPAELSNDIAPLFASWIVYA